MVYPKSHIHLVPFVAVALAFFLALAAAPALAQMSMRLIPFDSVTLSSQQVLLGETQGKPVTLAGELRLPNLGTGKVPVVVLDHGIAGLTSNHDEWARVLNGWGIAAFIPDHLSGRGIAPMSPDDFMLSPLARMVDVYHALSRLSKEPRIDSERIALMGFSFGGLVTLLSSQERFHTRYGLPNVQFAAYIPVYANCAYRFQDDAKVAARPIRLFHGTGDNWCPAEQCRALVADMKKAGADVTLTEYPGASHAYDDQSLKARLNLPQAPSLRKCLLVEGEGGQILNSQTGKPLAPSDSCLEYGVSLQYDEAATMSTREAVKAVLASAFAAKPAAAAPTATQAQAAVASAQSLQDQSIRDFKDIAGKWEGKMESTDGWSTLMMIVINEDGTGDNFVPEDSPVFAFSDKGRFSMERKLVGGKIRSTNKTTGDIGWITLREGGGKRVLDYVSDSGKLKVRYEPVPK
jgi:dienelactone hydrolase